MAGHEDDGVGKTGAGLKAYFDAVLGPASADAYIDESGNVCGEPESGPYRRRCTWESGCRLVRLELLHADGMDGRDGTVMLDVFITDMGFGPERQPTDE